MNHKNEFFLTIGAVVFVFILLIICMIFVDLKQAETDARLFNEVYKTNYTTSDFYWSGRTIRRYLTKGPQTTNNINFGVE